VITEVKQALGSWDVSLSPATPREVLDQLAEFGHVAVLPGRVDVVASGDNLLPVARYVGVVRRRASDATDQTKLSGVSLAFWLGDEDDKGDVFVAPRSFTGATFADTVRGLLPSSGAIAEGILHSVPGSYSGTHQYETPRSALTYVTDTFGTETYPVSWRVNGDGTLDAGRDADLYVAVPRAILVRDALAGRDMFLSGMSGQLGVERDVEDYTSTVVLLAEGEGSSTVTATATNPSPYLDLFGNPVVATRLVSEFETDATNAPARAQLQLNRFTNPRHAVSLSTDEYDVKGEFAVGDTIYVYDPDIGFTDATNEVTFRGQVLNPMAITVSELSWPVPDGWTVAYRGQDGTWVDLSEHYVPESGTSTVTVGEFSRSINAASSQPVGSRPVGDSSIPDVPVFGPASTSSYQSDNSGSGATFAQIKLTWSQPLNTDGSTVLDGNRYDIRWRPSGSSALVSWEGTSVPWGQDSFLITGLIPGTSYDFQIQAVDAAVPPHTSGWSPTLIVVSSIDQVAPSTPAAPSVAASLIAIQVTHALGKSSGGTFNLEIDLDHFDVHVGPVASFTPSGSTLVGKLAATVANIRGQIPAVGTFPVDATAAVWVKVVAVDASGNASGASAAASSTALLIDNAHISDLSVSKVTAGTIGATWIQGGRITTAASGARVELAADGLNAFNAAGTKTVEIKGSDGSATVTGRFRTGFPGAGQPYLDMINAGDRTTITLYNADQSNSAFINSPQIGVVPTLGMNSGQFTLGSVNYRQRAWLAGPSGIRLETINQANGELYGGALGLFIGQARLGHYFSTGDQTGGMLYTDQNYGVLERNGSGINNGGRFEASITGSRIGAYNTGILASEMALLEDESIWLTGRFSADNAIGGKSALFVGTWDINGLTNPAFTVTYGSTMATLPFQQITLARFTATGNPGWRLSGFDFTGFTVSPADTLNRRINYWCYRIL
jgi:hypothetical protein